jgi:hypothetical protein
LRWFVGYTGGDRSGQLIDEHDERNYVRVRRRPEQSGHRQQGGDASQQRDDTPVAGAGDQPAIALVPFVACGGIRVV